MDIIWGIAAAGSVMLGLGFALFLLGDGEGPLALASSASAGRAARRADCRRGGARAGLPDGGLLARVVEDGLLLGGAVRLPSAGGARKEVGKYRTNRNAQTTFVRTMRAMERWMAIAKSDLSQGDKSIALEIVGWEWLAEHQRIMACLWRDAMRPLPELPDSIRDIIYPAIDWE